MFKFFEEDGECWLWSGRVARSTGVVCLRRDDGTYHVTTVARRMWALLGRDKPTITRITRSCGNGRCVRPEHLVAETAEDLWRVDESTGCWVWLPRKLSYAVGSRTYHVRRIVWSRAHGGLPPRATVKSSCGSGNRRCINPRHLQPLRDGQLWKEDAVTGCWIWQHQLGPGGGAFSIRGQRTSARRLMWNLTHDQAVPLRTEVRVRCGRTFCVNPIHLELGPDQPVEWFRVTDRGCWEWTGYKSQTGYGRLKVDGKPQFVHRHVWELYRGPIPKGLCVRHRVCDNPPCCNPDHLALGTLADNARDMTAKLRGGHQLTWTQREAILSMRAEGKSFVAIARVFGVNPRLIFNVVHKISYVPAGENRPDLAKRIRQHSRRVLRIFDAEPQAIAPPIPSSPRFPYEIVASGCWEWRGGRTRHGYGVRHHLAHRIMWQATYGDIPPGLSVMHRCDNPPCVNPQHLRLGTPMDNARDRAMKLRGPHKLTYDQADEIRVERTATGTSFQKLAQRYGVSKKLAMMICRNLVYVRP